MPADPLHPHVQVHLRPATDADASAVRSVVFEVLREYGLSPDPEGADRDVFDLGKSYPPSEGAFAVLCAADGTVVGTVGVRPPDESPTGPSGGGRVVELRKMYLLPAYRGCGHGGTLIEWAVDEARHRGYSRMRLETASVLREAIRLYERRGFRRIEGCPSACRCDWVMEREL